MVCFHPVAAAMSVGKNHLGKHTVRVFGKKKPPNFYNVGNLSTWKPIKIKCRGCPGCRYARASEWAARCMHEAQLHKENSFITLTYAPEHLPADRSLDYRTFQLFMKKLRKWHGKKIRFYMCGEYGSKLGRPHYHAIIFGLRFPDMRLHKVDKDTGEILYSSKILEKIWGLGFASIGTVTYNSANYCARYIVDKINGELAEEHYLYQDPDTGELFSRTPEFNKMSLKPGIGAEWFKKYGSTDVFPQDSIIVKGRPAPVPAYYNKLYEQTHEDVYQSIKIKRALDAAKRQADNTPERLAVRKAVFLAKTRSLKRSLQ